LLPLLVAVLVGGAGAAAALAATAPAKDVAKEQAAPAPMTAPAQPAATAAKPASKSTADHSRFKELQKPFATGPDVTKACLVCHTEAAKQIHKTKHWTWEFLNPENQQRLGKKNIVNNFCTAVPSNYEFCTACHVGYNWRDQNFDFKSEVNVDCLTCHDTTGTYRKVPGLAGHPTYKRIEFPPKSGKFLDPPDLTKVAQNVGPTSRRTCGSCHFYGGGGDGVKHGDMDSSLANPGRFLDIHMAKDELNFTCATCHMTSGHDIPGSRYTPTAVDRGGAHIRGKAEKSSPTTCVACHGNQPHGKEAKLLDARADKLNMHAKTLACQTCHIPYYARGNVATKTLWDWSTAGKLKDGKPFVVKDSAGRVTYDSKKGDFRYESHGIPDYQWFNGKVVYTLLGDKLDHTKVVQINRFEGGPGDGLIWPVKVFRGKQPFDLESKSLVIPHTFGDDNSAYWSNFDWEKAIEAGMKSVGAPFSGKVGFVESTMVWPLTHMVSPKEDTLTCQSCHSKNGRLKSLAGIYVPGSHNNRYLDWLGWLAAAAALLAVIVHGGFRIYTSRKGG
jgi:octaheme c-type cytochrome (tetrathionate reductase family)